MSHDERTQEANDRGPNISSAPAGGAENKAGDQIEASNKPTQVGDADTSASDIPPTFFQRFMHKHFPDAKAHDRWTLVFTAVIAVSTFLYTIFAGWTLHEIHSGGTDTHALAVAAKNQAGDTSDISQAAQDQVDAADEISDAADSFSETADKIRNDTNRAVDQLKRAADDSEKAIAKSSANAKASLDASIEASRLDQRAWVSLVFPVELLDTKQIGPYVPFRFKIKFKNTGKTPAIKISYDPMLIQQAVATGTYPDYDVAHAGQRPYMEQVGITESALLGPSEEGFITYPGQPVNGRKLVFDKGLVDSINNIQTALFIVGMVSYHDVFPGTPERHTKFCLLYVPTKDVSEVGQCPKNRTMD
jgi:hypothetical protein